MLKNVTLKFTENADLTIPAQGITIIVGPNNSGKSLLLREIETAFTIHPFPDGLKILRDYDISWPDKSSLTIALDKYSKFNPKDSPEGQITVGRINPNGGFEGTQYNRDSFIQIAEQKSDTRWWATQYLRWGLVRLDGRSRFNLTNDQSGGDLLARPGNVLSHLFVDENARARVREIVHDAFGLFFVIDPTNLGTLRIRLSERAPLNDEQSLNPEAREFHSNAIYVKDASDGVQAFTGIATAVLSGEFHTILIDEPEAFLHPPLARKLGKHLSSLATERGGSLMASTHSPDFLMGCIQATKDVRVLRLEYSSGKSRGRMVDPDKLESFLKKPLMRSANVISALFYDGVIVTESDNDRAFYAEIYHRVAETGTDYPSILFVNAQNKQTIRDIIGPLREFGVPAAAIVDIDIIKDGGKDWTEWLKSARVPDALHIGYGQQRSSIKDVFIASGKDMKKDGGIEILSGPDRLAAESLFSVLDGYGIFAVRRGELEHWLPALDVPGRKTDWTVNMLDRMGSDPASPTYVRPDGKDVWAFIEKIVLWVKDPARLGM